jgi:histidine ammonia-lyase
MGEGKVRTKATALLTDAASALGEVGPSTQSSCRRRKGLALINGTDGMLGMLCLALTDLDRLLRTADHLCRDERRGAARHRRRLRR